MFFSGVMARYWFFILIRCFFVHEKIVKLVFFSAMCCDSLYCRKQGDCHADAFMSYADSCRLLSGYISGWVRMNNSDLYLSKKCGRILSPGKMSDSQFWLLAEISPVHSEKVLNALRDFLVLGYTRKEACERHEVSPGYFSGALGRIQRTHQTVNRLVPFYRSGGGIPYTG